MLLSLVAHADGYRMMVGAHNTVGCRMHVGGCVILFSMANAGAHNTVDAQRHGEPYRMELMAPTIL